MAHSGRYGGQFTIAPTASMMSTSYLFRNQPSPPQGYYSAWFYVPSTIAVGAWLSLTHFTGSDTGDGKNLSAIWDVNLYPLLGGGLAAQLYDYLGTTYDQRQTIPVPFPLDTWVQLEVYLSKAIGPTGEVTVWQDGVQVLQRFECPDRQERLDAVGRRGRCGRQYSSLARLRLHGRCRDQLGPRRARFLTRKPGRQEPAGRQAGRQGHGRRARPCASYAP